MDTKRWFGYDASQKQKQGSIHFTGIKKESAQPIPTPYSGLALSRSWVLKTLLKETKKAPGIYFFKEIRYTNNKFEYLAK